MNDTIYKFEIENMIMMPKGSEVLSVDFQDGIPFLWALVEPGAEMETRTFQMIETGKKLSVGNLLVKPTFLGTIKWFDGNYVLHIFEDVKIQL